MASADLLKKFKFDTEESAEVHLGYQEKTGFPEPQFRYRLVSEAVNQYVEEAYFWTMDQLKYDWGFNQFNKITDVNAASEGSSFFGLSEQRLGVQQDKASQFLKGISEMLKALFQLVRELRIIDERLGYYEHSFQRKGADEAVGSDITLKGIWVDQVEGGAKNAASVYGLAQTVGFTVLPDLFFRVRADDRGVHNVADNAHKFDERTKEIIDDVDHTIERMEGFNKKVKEVLGRKLVQYYMWKLRTYKELKARKQFTLKYLRQHYDTIKLYTGWIKPYLRNIRRLQASEKHVDTADLVTAFEGAVIEIEVLSVKKKPEMPYHACVLIHFYYRTRPSLNYMQEGYQRGPTHTGKFEMTLRGYVWSENEIKNYLRMKEEEDMELFSEVDASIKDSMESLGEELKEYLRQAGEQFDTDKHDEHEEPPKPPGILEPFGALAGSMKDFLGAVGIKKGGGHEEHTDPALHHAPLELDEEFDVTRADLKRSIWQTYKNYKKLHGMLTWG